MKKSGGKGFTLVECIVAMAILMVFALALMMILNVTVKQRNSNMKIESDIDSQVEKLYQDKENATVSESVSNGDIDFGNGISISGAHKVYYDDPDSELQIAALEYDVASSPSTGDPEEESGKKAENNGETPTKSSTNDYKVYGAVDIVDWVTISETQLSESDDSYTMQWTVSFKVNSGNNEKSLKVVFPTGATGITCTSVSFCENPILIDKITVRIQPYGKTDEWGGMGTKFTWADTSVSAIFTFDIPKDYRDGNTTKNITGYKSVSNYFTGADSGSSAFVLMNKEYVNGNPK